MAVTSNINVLKDKKILQYPMGLGSSEKDGYDNDVQYMMIKIQTDSKSTKLRGDKSTGGVAVTNARTGVGVGTANFKSTANKDIDPDIRLKYGDSAVNKEQWRVQKGMVRLDKVVILPMPDTHVVGTYIQYDQNYNPSILTKAGDLINQSGNGMGGELASLVKNAAISGLVNTLKSGSTSVNSLLAEERLAINPKKEVMFNSFGFREFQFVYRFAPKSQVESSMVNEIIETLRYYSLPEISAAKLFYIFPSEFEISFMLGKTDNPNIPRITTSVLRNIDVNYSPSGVWATLPNGAPVALEVTMNFIELEMVDRKRVYNADSPITSGY